DVLPIVPKRSELRYPKVGQNNPVVSLTIADVASGELRRVELARFPKDCLIVRVGWTPDSKACLFAVQDRIQTWYELCEVVVDGEASSATPRTLLREAAERGWTDRLPLPRWLSDGSFLWTSHRSGFRKLYRYKRNGTLIAELWQDGFGLASILRVDDTGLTSARDAAGSHNEVWVSGYSDNSVDLHAFRVNLDGSGARRLTAAHGVHRVVPSPDGRYVLDTWSSLEDPGRVELRDREGELVRVLADARVKNRDGLFSATWRNLRIPARDGYVLDAALLGSADGSADGGKKPIWIETYSGPHAPSVRNAWNGRAWFHFLAQEGLLVLQVNVRSAEPVARMRSV
ncbi:MAG TPA: DPP IV N-terminal domain-containing protein, partial [Planctomycetota bacterium]|nr:DPP IV N-terminal domain-containing protein [Planctomycetota bacterium]